MSDAAAVRAGAPVRARGAWWATLTLSVLAGGLHALSLAPTPCGALQVLALALLVALLSGGADHLRTPRQAAWIGALFGTTWLASTFWWLFISMHRYGQLPAWLAALAVLALAAALALVVVLAAVLFVRWRRGHPGWDALLWAALWLASELLRGQIFTGFPWGASGYAHVDGPLALLAPWAGVYGMGAAAAALSVPVAAGLRALWLRRGAAGVLRPAISVVILVGLGLLPAGRGTDFTAPAGSLSVTLLQGNVAQDEKFDPSHLPATLTWHVRALQAAQTDLVIAPETAIPLLPDQLPQGLWAALEQRFSQGRTHALIGVPLGDFESGYTNAAAGLAPGQPAYRYDKHHLVPFGEFIPWGFRWFVTLMQMPLGDFSRGPLAPPSFAVAGQRVAPNICYEDLFGEELAARFIDEARAPTVLANVSNIGWFGETVAVDQHLQISRLRALELQRPMLRATNTGATVIIDHRGRVTDQLAPHRQGVLVGQAEGRTGLTPFARWAGRWGLWPLWGAALLALLAVVRRKVTK